MTILLFILKLVIKNFYNILIHKNIAIKVVLCQNENMSNFYTVTIIKILKNLDIHQKGPLKIVRGHLSIWRLLVEPTLPGDRVKGKHVSQLLSI